MPDKPQTRQGALQIYVFKSHVWLQVKNMQTTTKTVVWCPPWFPRMPLQRELSEMRAGVCVFEDHVTDLTECTLVTTLGCPNLAVPGFRGTDVPRWHAVHSGVTQASITITTFTSLGWITHPNPPMCRARVVPKVWGPVPKSPHGATSVSFLPYHPPIFFSCCYPSSSSKDDPWPKLLSGPLTRGLSNMSLIHRILEQDQRAIWSELDYFNVWSQNQVKW